MIIADSIYYRSARDVDAPMIVACKNDWKLETFAPKLWHDRDMKVPTYAGALVIQKKFGLRVRRTEHSTSVVRGLDGLMEEDLQPIIMHHALIELHECPTWGAGAWIDQEHGRQIAEGLAFRAAVEHWLESVSLKRETRKNLSIDIL